MPVDRKLGIRISEDGVVSYPLEPFAQWLDELVEAAKAEYDYRPGFGNQHRPKHEKALSPVRRVAVRCGVDYDTLCKWRRRSGTWIDERVVDAVVSMEGSRHIAEIYPQYRLRPEALTKQYRRRPAIGTSVLPATERSI